MMQYFLQCHDFLTIWLMSSANKYQFDRFGTLLPVQIPLLSCMHGSWILGTSQVVSEQSLSAIRDGNLILILVMCGFCIASLHLEFFEGHLG